MPVMTNFERVIIGPRLSGKEKSTWGKVELIAEKKKSKSTFSYLLN